MDAARNQPPEQFLDRSLGDRSLPNPSCLQRPAQGRGSSRSNDALYKRFEARRSFSSARGATSLAGMLDLTWTFTWVSLALCLISCGSDVSQDPGPASGGAAGQGGAAGSTAGHGGVGGAGG